MGPFHPAHRRIAADRPRIKPAVEAGKPAALPADLLEIRFGRGMDDVRAGLFRPHFVDVVQVPLGRAAAVVAELQRYLRHHSHVDRDQLVAIVRRTESEITHDATAAGPDDSGAIDVTEQLAGRQSVQVLLLLIRPAEEIGMIAGFGQDLDQSPGMTEGIEIGRRLDVHAEGFPEITFADENLADERFARGHVAVGLDEPAAQHGPAPAGSHNA